jgi:hypothetical protein
VRVSKKVKSRGQSPENTESINTETHEAITPTTETGTTSDNKNEQEQSRRGKVDSEVGKKEDKIH